MYVRLSLSTIRSVAFRNESDMGEHWSPKCHILVPC